MLFSASRYNHISSVSICILSSVAVIEISEFSAKFLKKKNRIYLNIGIPLGIYALFLYLSSTQGITQIGPRMNDYWYDALIWAKNNTNKSDGFITWWDHGSWVQYFSERPTVVDSVYGQSEARIRRIAKFLATNESDTFRDWGNPKYLIVSVDALFYKDSITSLGGVSRFDATISYYYKQENGKLIFYVGNGRFEVTENSAYFISGNTKIPVQRVIFEVDNLTRILRAKMPEGVEFLDGCLHISKLGAVYVDRRFCNSNYFKLMFEDGIDNYTLVYRNLWVRIYEIK